MAIERVALPASVMLSSEILFLISASAASALRPTFSCHRVGLVNVLKGNELGMYCSAGDFWADCASKVKKAIQDTQDPAVALQAAAEWSERFEALYAANAQSGWTTSDNDRLQSLMESSWEDTIGKYLDPASLAFDLAFAKYFPRLAAVLEWAGSAPVAVFFVLIAPSPIANSFTEAVPINKEINDLLRTKLPGLSRMTIEQSYPDLFKQSFETVKGPGILP